MSSVPNQLLWVDYKFEHGWTPDSFSLLAIEPSGSQTAHVHSNGKSALLGTALKLFFICFVYTVNRYVLSTYSLPVMGLQPSCVPDYGDPAVNTTQFLSSRSDVLERRRG